MNELRPISIIAVAGLLAACGQEPAEPEASTDAMPATVPEAPEPPAPQATMPDVGGMPARIVAERGGFVPEGIEFDTANRRFLTGSASEGTIFEIANDGSMTPAVLDPALMSSIGIEADEPRDRLLVANSDIAVFSGESAGQAMLGVYSLTTGERIAMVDLAPLAGGGDEARNLANDVAVADDGTAYVTDTMSGVIYRVDTEYEASLFYRFEPMEGLSPNGIVAHPDGYLIVAASVPNGILYKVPFDDPDAAAPVALDNPVVGADGMDWTSDGRLAVVSNSGSSVHVLTSADGWTSAQTVATAAFEGQGTTGTEVDDAFYVVQPQFNQPGQPVILRVDF